MACFWALPDRWPRLAGQRLVDLRVLNRSKLFTVGVFTGVAN